VTTSAGTTTSTPLTGDATLSATGFPALASLTSGMPTGATSALGAAYTPGTKAPINGAPVLPSFTFSAADWPNSDKPPDPTSPEVQQWMKELDGHNIPDIPTSLDGTCASSPDLAANAQANGWWTCGGWTRPTDIVDCPTKMTWGISFDDGPSFYTPNLLDYLQKHNIKSTFFVVGSRAIEFPQILVAEYMAGHEIAVHTWSHRSLTTQSNAQIVAELGWTRKAIKEILGVTPVYMRPPYGDIDDRVRAISLAMGMVPMIWTRPPPPALPFDTNDWKVAGGLVGPVDSYDTFQSILTTATSLNTGFVVLQHDLFELTVDLATGYTLPAAQSHNPPFNIQAIGQCRGFPPTDLYRETTTNTTFPYPNSTSADIDGDGSTGDTQGGSSAAMLSSLGTGYLVGLVAVLISALW